MVGWGKKKEENPLFLQEMGRGRACQGAAGLQAAPPDLVPCCRLSVWDSVTCPCPRVLPADAWERVPTFPRQKPGSSHSPGWSSRAPAGRRSAEGLYLEEKEERW